MISQLTSENRVRIKGETVNAFAMLLEERAPSRGQLRRHIRIAAGFELCRIQTKKKFLDRTNYYGQVTTADKSGRVLIPPLLRESAQMTGEVAVLGYLDHLDVWNHKRFLGRIKEHEFTEDDKEMLSKLGI